MLEAWLFKASAFALASAQKDVALLPAGGADGTTAGAATVAPDGIEPTATAPVGGEPHISQVEADAVFENVHDEQFQEVPLTTCYTEYKYPSNCSVSFFRVRSRGIPPNKSFRTSA